MKEINIATWERRDIYETFKSLELPFYHVAFRVDVTALKSYTRARGLSFYYSLVYMVGRAANSIMNFRLRYLDGKIYDVGDTVPSLTFMHKGREAFQVVNCALTPDMDSYTTAVRSLTDAQTAFMGGEDVAAYKLLYVSCLPWLDMLSSSSERSRDPFDAIPRIAWGKYVADADGRLTLGMSIDVNHKFVDGYHIGLFYERLQDMINDLASICPGLNL